MSIAKVLAGAAVIAMAGAGYLVLSRPNLSCNTPALSSEFQKLLEKERAQDLEFYQQLLTKARTDLDTKYANSQIQFITNAVLHIQRTVTLGTEGNFLSCEMTYDHGDPQYSAKFQYLLGKDDAGNVVWRSSDFAPYKLMPE